MSPNTDPAESGTEIRPRPLARRRRMVENANVSGGPWANGTVVGTVETIRGVVCQRCTYLPLADQESKGGTDPYHGVRGIAARMEARDDRRPESLRGIVCLRRLRLKGDGE